METLLKNLKELRLSKNWSQEAVAEEMGMSSRMYSAYERGESNFTADMIFKLSKLYKISIDDLYEPDILSTQQKTKEKNTARDTQTEYVALPKPTKKVSIELDLNKVDDLNIFNMFLGNRYPSIMA